MAALNRLPRVVTITLALCACAGRPHEGVGVGAYAPTNPAPAPAPAPALPEAVYSGRLIVGFETSAFTPCGSAEKWWLDGKASQIWEFTKQQRAAADADSAWAVRLFVSVRGAPSATGNHGHLGQYTRRIDVVEVLEVREYRATDCEGQPGV
jgi:hypothetical protein